LPEFKPATVLNLQAAAVIITFMKIKCEACGTEYENATSSICDNCGYRMIRIKPQKVGENPEKVRCVKCGASYAWGTKICGNCGDLLRYKE